MNIIGPDTLIFGVDDVAQCSRFLEDYGLTCTERSSDHAAFEALDGTGMVIRHLSDPLLAPAIAPGANLREVIYGVADAATLEAIGAELSRDRAVVVKDGVLRTHDDDGYPLGFQISCRRPIEPQGFALNRPGAEPGRGPNLVAALDDERPRACTLSHYVVFTHDKHRAERFYADRLGFRTVDEFTNLGPFMRPAGTQEHHTLFLIEAPKLGIQHFTFHFAGPNELLKAGWEMTEKGYKTNWGPGRHILGSNYFWYFDSPFGGDIEMDADMDQHDDSWIPRRIPADRQTSQTFLLQQVKKYSPAEERRVLEASRAA